MGRPTLGFPHFFLRSNVPLKCVLKPEDCAPRGRKHRAPSQERNTLVHMQPSQHGLGQQEAGQELGQGSVSPGPANRTASLHPWKRLLGTQTLDRICWNQGKPRSLWEHAQLTCWAAPPVQTLTQPCAQRHLCPFTQSVSGVSVQRQHIHRTPAICRGEPTNHPAATQRCWLTPPVHGRGAGEATPGPSSNTKHGRPSVGWRPARPQPQPVVLTGQTWREA